MPGSASHLAFVGDFADVYSVDYGLMVCIRICCGNRKLG
jgi:hypothetical protein